MGFRTASVLCIFVLCCITEVFGITSQQAAHLTARLAEVKTKVERVTMRVGDTRDLVISLLQTPLPTVARHKAASCSEIKSLNPEADNGEYTLYPFSTDKNVSLRVYCHDMGSGNPKEFLSLPSGPDENYAIVIPDRLDSNYMYVQQCTGPLQNPYSEAGTTKFSKLRITFEGSRVEVIQDDYIFAQTTGPNAIRYAHAGDCYSGLQGCAKGRFKVDLTGTELSLAPGVHWEMGSYWPKYLTIQDMFISEDRKVASAFCGGWCGLCRPVGNELYLMHSQR